MRGSPRSILAAGLGLALLVSGCSWWPSFRNPIRSTDYSQQDLHEDLLAYASRFAAVVSGAAERIEDRAESRDVRRSTLVWRIRMIPALQGAAFGEEPRESYVETVGLAVAMRSYLTEGDGRDVFGEHQPIAVAAARDLEATAYEIGGRFLQADQLDALRAGVEDFVRDHPIRGRDFNVQTARTGPERLAAPATGLGWVIGIPLSPFRALEGVGSTGTAMLELNRTADEFAQIVDELPRQSRWQLQLLLYDIEDRDTTRESLAAFQQVADSADRVSQAIDRLPGDLRVSLEESEAAIAEAHRALRTAQELMGPVSATVAEIGRISERLAAMERDGDDEPDPDARPFDIREYEATARQVGSSAAELRALLDELEGVLETGRLESAVQSTVDGTSRRLDDLMGDWIGRGRMAAAQLLVLFFALLLAYRWLSHRIGRESGRAQ